MRRWIGSMAVIASIAVALTAAPAGATDTVSAARVAGGDRHATAAAVAGSAFPDGATAAVLARGDAFPDALAGSFLAGATTAPVLLTAGDRLSSAASGALRELGVDTVHVLGGTGAISAAVSSQLAADGYTVRRVAGANRYATAAVIAASGTVGELDGKRTVLLAGGADFPDALAAGPVAFAGRLPILLTPADALAPEAAGTIRELDIAHVVVLGGTAAVSDAVVAEITALGATSERLAGASRYETAAAIADFAVSRLGWAGTSVGIARGDAFPDGLAGGPHGGRSQAAMLLTAPDALSPETAAWLSAHTDTVSSITAFGGTAAVSDAALGEARAAAGDASGAGGFAVVGGASTTDLGAERTCRVVSEAGATLNLLLLPSSHVSSTGGSTPTFRDADADGAADRGAPSAGISSLEGRTLSPPPSSIEDVRSDGDLSVGVSGDEVDSVVLVAYIDGEEGTAHELDVDEKGAPVDVAMTGCQTVFAAPDAPAGGHQDVEVGSVDAASGVFMDAAGEHGFRFDADDTYRSEGSTSSHSDFIALVSQGDVIDIDYAPGGASTFDVVADNVVPAGAPAIAMTGSDATVSFQIPASNGAGTTYQVFRARTHPEDNGCSEEFAQTGATVGTTPVSPFTDKAVPDGCWRYRINTVASNGAVVVSSFSDPVKAPGTPSGADTVRPTSVYATVVESGAVDRGVLGAGDTIRIVFDEPMTTPTTGASITVASQGASATITSGSSATFSLNTSTVSVGGAGRPPGTVLTVTVNANPAAVIVLPASITTSSGITDKATNTWDVASSDDRTLEAS